VENAIFGPKPPDILLHFPTTLFQQQMEHIPALNPNKLNANAAAGTRASVFFPPDLRPQTKYLEKTLGWRAGGRLGGRTGGKQTTHTEG
jgi:hypothetical protein